jgi:fatty acid-binding protein DegV
VKPGGTVFKGIQQILAYANDTAIRTGNTNASNEILDQIQATSYSAELIITIEKLKYMMECGRS